MRGKKASGCSAVLSIGPVHKLTKVLTQFLAYNHFEITAFVNHQKGCRLDT